MFKNKNIVTKISNTIILFIFIVMLLTGVSLLLGNDISASYSNNDFLYNSIMTAIYVIVSGTFIILLNKKINLYKDEYPVSRQVFNLIYVVMLISIIISMFMIIVGAFVYKEFSLYTLLSLIISLGTSTGMFVYVSKGRLINNENSKKKNVINLVIAILFVEYVSDFLISALQLIFKTNESILIIKYMIVYLVGMCIVTLAYYLFQKSKDKELIILRKEKLKDEIIEETVEETTLEKEVKIKITKSKKSLTKSNKKDKKG